MHYNYISVKEAKLKLHSIKTTTRYCLKKHDFSHFISHNR